MALTSSLSGCRLRAARGAARPAARRAAACVASASAGKEYMSKLAGISAPFGDAATGSFWDPLGFTDSPAFNVSEAKRFRESEVTHGRVAMLAVLGWFVAEEFHPLFGGRIGGPAFQHFQFWEFVVLVLGIAESARVGKAYSPVLGRASEQIKEDYKPGELGFDPLGLFPTDEAAAKELQTKELNNGRLAMFAIAGFAAQEEVDHITIWKGLVLEKIVPAEDANLLPF